MKITFLGTGTSQGIPVIGCDCPVCTSGNRKDNRLRTSVWIETANTSIVIDSGPDFRYQMLRARVNWLDAVLFTHPHKDHVAGLDDIRAYNFFSGKDIPVYANEMTQAVLIREFPYAFADTRYPGVPEIALQTINDEPFYIGDIPVVPVEVWHMKMPVLGFRIGDFTYITDANRIEEVEKEKIKGSRILVLNALRKEKHLSHFTLQEAVDMVNELQIPEAYLTHVSHQLGKHATVNAELPKHIRLAYDGLVINCS